MLTLFEGESDGRGLGSASVRSDDVPTIHLLRRHALLAAKILVVVGAYYGGGRLGLLSPIGAGDVSPLWPPTGIALVALLLWGPRVWPGVAIGAVLINYWPGEPPIQFVGSALGSALAPLLGYLMLRAVDFRATLERLKDVIALLVLGGMTAMVVSATFSVVSLWLAGVLPRSAFAATWLVWWTGDAMGVLILAPLLLTARYARWPREIHPYRVIEAATLLATMLAVIALALHSPEQLLFIVFPFIIWAAWRFQLAGATPCVFLVTAISIYAASRGLGSFAGDSVLSHLITLQAFSASTTLTALVLSVTISARNDARAHVREVASQLATVVNQLDRRLRPRPEAPPYGKRDEL
ncbi:MASE1 domain-containing protein [Actinopolymorpha pittospori]